MTFLGIFGFSKRCLESWNLPRGTKIWLCFICMCFAILFFLLKYFPHIWHLYALNVLYTWRNTYMRLYLYRLWKEVQDKMIHEKNMSGVRCHMSSVRCQVSGVTIFYFFYLLFIYLFFLYLLKSGGASRWRVCYQRGLPRIVLIQGWFAWHSPP